MTLEDFFQISPFAALIIVFLIIVIYRLSSKSGFLSTSAPAIIKPGQDLYHKTDDGTLMAVSQSVDGNLSISLSKGDYSTEWKSGPIVDGMNFFTVWDPSDQKVSTYVGTGEMGKSEGVVRVYTFDFLVYAISSKIPTNRNISSGDIWNVFEI